MQFRRYAGRFAAGLLLVSSMISPALAVTGTVASGDTTLRVRSEASTAGEVLTKLDNGVQVEVLSTVDSGDRKSTRLNSSH